MGDSASICPCIYSLKLHGFGNRKFAELSSLLPILPPICSVVGLLCAWDGHLSVSFHKMLQYPGKNHDHRVGLLFAYCGVGLECLNSLAFFLFFFPGKSVGTC